MLLLRGNSTRVKLELAKRITGKVRDYARVRRGGILYRSLINPFKNYAASVLTPRKHVRMDSAMHVRARMARCGAAEKCSLVPRCH